MRRTQTLSWSALAALLVSACSGSHSTLEPGTSSPNITGGAGKAGQGPVAGNANTSKVACGTGKTPCETSDFGGATCSTVMGTSGQLLCDPVTCMFDTSMCAVMPTDTAGRGGMAGRGAAGPGGTAATGAIFGGGGGRNATAGRGGNTAGRGGIGGRGGAGGVSGRAGQAGASGSAGASGTAAGASGTVAGASGAQAGASGTAAGAGAGGEPAGAGGQSGS